MEFSVTNTLGTFKLLLSISLLLLTSCGGGGGNSSAPDPDLLSGRFIDSPVEGLQYERMLLISSTATETTFSVTGSGITDVHGTFRYKEGELIEFFIGNIRTHVRIPPKPVLTPNDFIIEFNPGTGNFVDDAGLNFARFLQTLDDDANVNNGITISEAVRQHASTLTQFPGFSGSTSLFGVGEFMTDFMAGLTSNTTAGTRQMVNANSAQNHLNTTLSQLEAGTLPVLYGGFSGAYSIDVKNCLDSTDNGVFDFSVVATINFATHTNFGMTLVGTNNDFGSPLVETITLTGLISDSGEISGDSTHTFVDSEGAGSFIGQLNRDIMTITNSGADTSGDICTYTRNISINR